MLLISNMIDAVDKAEKPLVLRLNSSNANTMHMKRVRQLAHSFHMQKNEGI
jgi:hypothetical protein